MRSLREDFHKATHKKITNFIKTVEKFAAEKNMQAAYDELPETLTDNLTINELVFDDLLDSFAITMANVPDAELPVAVYHSLMNAREGKAVPEAEARADLLNSTKNARAMQEKDKDYFPDFIAILAEIAPPSKVKELGREWIKLVDDFGTLTITDPFINAISNAKVVTQNTAIMLSALDDDKLVSEGDTYEITNKDTPALPGPSAPALFVSKELTDLLKRSAKEVSTSELPVMHGRGDDVGNISGVLLRKDAPYIALHGEEGVGKGTVIQAVAKSLSEGRGPGHMKKGKVFSVSLEWLAFKDPSYSSTVKELVRLTAQHNKINPGEPIILYINDYGLSSPAVAGPVALMRANMNFELKTSPGAMVIAEMTDTQMFALDKSDPESMKKFQKIAIGELAIPATAGQLNIEAQKLSRHHKLTISDDAIDHIIRKTTRFMPAMFHPDKDLKVLAAATALSELNGDTTLTDQSIDLSISKIAMLPISLVGGEASERIDNLEGSLNKQIFGQEHVVKEIAETIGLVNQGLQDPKKPLGVFYLTGPTGVGKTALVKALAESLFADEDALIRINLGDFQEKHTVSRITGAPPGYVGYGEKTALEDINVRPFSVVLVDEAEKGHPDVDNVLMNIMDEGELTLLNGTKLNFRNAVIVFTSNIGASDAEAALNRPGIGFVHNKDNKTDALKAAELAAIARFKPEFRNRATFLALKPLTREVVEKITMKEVDKVSKRLRDNKLYAGIKIELTPQAVEELMNVGYDPKLGARPMQRAMQSMLQVPLGKWLNANKDSLLSREFKLVVNGLKDGLNVNVVYPSAPEQDNNKPPTPQVA